MGSLEDNTSGGSYAYRASKAAVNQVAKSLSMDLGAGGITVVLLHPGPLRLYFTISAAPWCIRMRVLMYAATDFTRQDPLVLRVEKSQFACRICPY